VFYVVLYRCCLRYCHHEFCFELFSLGSSYPLNFPWYGHLSFRTWHLPPYLFDGLIGHQICGHLVHGYYCCGDAVAAAAAASHLFAAAAVFLRLIGLAAGASDAAVGTVLLFDLSAAAADDDDNLSWTAAAGADSSLSDERGDDDGTGRDSALYAGIAAVVVEIKNYAFRAAFAVVAYPVSHLQKEKSLNLEGRTQNMKMDRQKRPPESFPKSFATLLF